MDQPLPQPEGTHKIEQDAPPQPIGGGEDAGMDAVPPAGTEGAPGAAQPERRKRRHWIWIAAALVLSLAAIILTLAVVLGGGWLALGLMARLYYNRGQACYARGEYGRAIAEYGRAIRLKPRYVEAYSGRGNAYQAQDDLERAITDYGQAIQLKPDYATAHYGRGLAYYDKGELDRAVADYDRAIQLQPDYAEAYNNRGIAYAEQGDLERAIADYGQAIQLQPDAAETYVNRGNVYAAQGDPDRAIADYDRAIQLKPDDALAYYDRGVAYTQKGDLDRAIADYDRAIQLKPDDAAAHNNRGIAYYDQGDLDRAIADYDQAIQLKPDFAEAYHNRGLAYANKGDLDRAIADYTQAIQLKPDYAEAYYSRGLAYAHKGDLDRAIADWDKAIQLKPDYAEAYCNRGLAYANKGDLDLAIADYDQAIQLQPDDALTYLNRGIAYADKGDPDRAIADWDKAIQLKPDYAEAYHNRGLAYYDKGDLDRAIADWDKAIQLKPDYAEAYHDRGLAYAHKGNYDRAIADLDQAIRLQPDNALAYLVRGIVYDLKDMSDEAIADFQKVLLLSADPQLRADAEARLKGVLAKVTPQPQELAVQGTYTHAESGMRLPERWGSFQRRTITQFDQAGRDVGANYNLVLPGAEALVTVYVYPANRPGPSDQALEAESEQVKSVVLSSHLGSKVLSEGPIEIIQDGQKIAGLKVVLSTEEDFDGQKQPCLSYLFLFVRGAWFVKYRVTHPAGMQQAVEPEVIELIEGLKMPAAEAGEKVKIALILPMSGPVPTFGQSCKEGAELAIQEWNEKGGLLGQKIEWVLADGGCDAAMGAEAARKVIEQDKVRFIVGEVCSGASIPISEIANSQKVIQISPTSVHPQVTLDKPFVFRACALDPLMPSAMATFARQDLSAWTAAVMYDKGNDYVWGQAETFKAAFEKLGGKVLVFEAYTVEATDFAAILSQVAEANPDVLFLPDYYDKVNLIGRQAKGKGIKAILLGGDGWDSPDLDLAAVDGGYYINYYSAADPCPIVQGFLKKYEDAYHRFPDALAVLSYDATHVLLQAIADAGTTDTSRVRDALAQIEFEGVSGLITFDREGDRVKAGAINRVTGGKIEFVRRAFP